MISIRECVKAADLYTFKEKHVNYVSKEVRKRIDFYLNLFNVISFLQINKNTHISTITSKVKIGMHHTQYLPFIKVIFNKEKKFTGGNYNDLKNLMLFKKQAIDFDLVIKKLKVLSKHATTIIGLDLSSKSEANKKYYELSKNEYKPIEFLLNKIFDYDWFLNKESNEEWGAYQLTHSLGLKVCSYCNRQYTFTLSKGTKKNTRPELDHFLPKATNPLLALTFFNLIPSCTICNRDCKGQIQFNYEDYLSPYEQNIGHGLMKYDYFPTTYLGSIGETDEVTVFIKYDNTILNSFLKKIKGNIRVFEYETIINEHKDIVQEIIRKKHMSNGNYLDIFRNSFPDAKLTLDEVYRLAYGNFYDVKEFNKRPLAKLTKDIAIGVGALKIYS